MEIFFGLIFYGVIIGIIIYCVKKKKREQKEYNRYEILRQQEKVKEEERIAEENKKEELKQEEERIQKYKILLNKFPLPIKKKIEGCVDYVRSHSTFANLLLVGCDPNYISKILEVMAFEIGVDFKLVEGSHTKSEDMGKLFSSISDGDFICFTNIGALKLESRLTLTKAILDKQLDLKIGKGIYARSIQIPLANFSTIIAVDNMSELPREMIESLYDIIDFKKYEYDFRLIFINDFIEKYSLIFTEDVKERLAKQFIQYDDLKIQLIEIRDKALELNVNQIGESFFEKTLNSIPEINKIDEMDGREFELFARTLLLKNGFENINVTQASCDFGVDIIAEKECVKYAIQCKRYNSSVGISAVQEVIASKSLHDCHIACVLTNNFFTPAAIELAKKNLVILWDRRELQKFIDNAKLSINE